MSRRSSSHSWTFNQVFGDTSSSQADDSDIISAVEFDETGDHLAIGDRGGRVVILERNDRRSRSPEFYRILTEFQSHEPEFDFLKSMEIEEKINCLKWFKQNDESLSLLTTNDKTIKLWRVTKHAPTKWNPVKLPRSERLTGPLEFPSRTSSSDVSSTTQKLRRKYGAVHEYHINSVSFNSDNESFLSADDLRINLWNVEHPRAFHTAVDIKPANIEELTEVITSASFHPIHCNTFLYSSSKGIIKICDLRESSGSNQTVQDFHVEEDPRHKTFFSEIIASISDAKFSPDGNEILQRDYMTLKVWDVRAPQAPSRVHHIHEQLRPKLCDLYENDCIFDKFECNWSGDSNQLLTGSYKDYFFSIDKRTGKQTSQLCTDQPTRKKKPRMFGRARTQIVYEPERGDFEKKCLHCSWHPRENVVACAALRTLFIFQQK